ncbi:ribosome biogenesis regulatory protein-domain-containing protein [Blastocladiella britannica]|nr:ribosome biogenesis regulatory protein-domain-containing protein [Blastocladiella britannica]
MEVTSTLKAAKSQHKPVTVERLAPPTLDLGHMAIFDGNAVTEGKTGADLESYLTSITRDSTQLLYNALFSLPTTSNSDGVFVPLPMPDLICPREKPLPKAAATTKWQQFAKEKGIQKRKTSRMEYDEATGEYRPRWGYGSAKNDAAADWLLPVPDNSDPYEDQYAKRRDEKNERVEKNAKQQRRNAAVADAESRGIDPRAARKAELDAKLRASKQATASRGVFDRKISGDVKPKGVRRQFAPATGGEANEREVAAELADKVIRKHVDVGANKDIKVQKATGMLQRAEERVHRAEKRRFGDSGSGGRGGRGGGRGGSRGGRGGGRGGKRPRTQ